MSITIHYRGRLRDPTQLPGLIVELQVACAHLGWPCQTVDERIMGVGERYEFVPIETDDDIPTERVEIVEEPLDDEWRGVVIQPLGCETLFLTFDRRSVLVRYGSALDSPLTPGRYSIERQLAGQDPVWPTGGTRRRVRPAAAGGAGLGRVGGERRGWLLGDWRLSGPTGEAGQDGSSDGRSLGPGGAAGFAEGSRPGYGGLGAAGGGQNGP